MHERQKSNELIWEWSIFWGSCLNSGITYLYPANTEEVGYRSKVKEGVVWRWVEEGAYFGVPAQTLLEEMFCWDEIPPKIGKHELESLGACYKS